MLRADEGGPETSQGAGMGQAGLTGIRVSQEWGFLDGSDGKESACSAEDPGSIPGSGRSPGEGNGNPLQYSCLENSKDRRAWQTSVHGA